MQVHLDSQVVAMLMGLKVRDNINNANGDDCDNCRPLYLGGPNVGPAPSCDNFSLHDQVCYTENTGAPHSNLLIIS